MSLGDLVHNGGKWSPLRGAPFFQKKNGAPLRGAPISRKLVSNPSLSACLILPALRRVSEHDARDGRVLGGHR